MLGNLFIETRNILNLIWTSKLAKIIIVSIIMVLLLIIIIPLLTRTSAVDVSDNNEITSTSALKTQVPVSTTPGTTLSIDQPKSEIPWGLIGFYGGVVIVVGALIFILKKVEKTS